MLCGVGLESLFVGSFAVYVDFLSHIIISSISIESTYMNLFINTACSKLIRKHAKSKDPLDTFIRCVSCKTALPRIFAASWSKKLCHG